MNCLRKLLVLSVGFVAFSDMVCADEPTYKLRATDVPDRQTIENQWGGSLDFVAWWMNLWIDRQVQGSVKRAIEKTISDQEQHLKWSGEGVLLRLEVIRQYDGNTPLTAVALFSDPAIVVGYGANKEEAWIQSRNTGTMGPVVPSGWEIDDVMSGYLWVQLDRRGHIVRTGVPKGTLVDLDRQMSSNWPLFYSHYLEAKANNLEVWKQVAEVAQKNLRDRAAIAAIQNSLKEVEESKTRVADINRRLVTALESEQAGAQALSFIRIMQEILSIAQLAKEASDEFGKTPGFSNATKASEVIQTADQIEKQRHVYSVNLKAEFDGSFEDLQKFLGQLWHDIQPANPPTTVQDSFHIQKPMP